MAQVKSGKSVLGWSALLQWSRIGLNALAFIIFTRWLDLKDIGEFAAAQAPLVALQAILQAAVPDAVVQSRGEDRQDHDSLFWLSVTLGAGNALVMLVFAWILRGTGNEKAALYAIAMAAIPIINALALVPDGILRKKLATRSLALRTLTASGLSSLVGIALVFILASGWALVAFISLNAVLNTGLTLLAARWRPSRAVSWQSIRSVAPGLAHISGRYTFGAIAWPAIQVAAALQLGPAASGALHVGNRIYTLLDTLAVAPLRYLLLPVFSRARDDVNGAPERVAAALAAASLLAAPFFWGAAAVAPVALPLLLGGASTDMVVEVTRLLCFYGPFISIAAVISHALTAAGRASLVLIRSAILFALVIIPTCLLSRVDAVAMMLYYALAGSTGSLILTILLCRSQFQIGPVAMARAIGRPLVAAALTALPITFLPGILPVATGTVGRLALLVGLALAGAGLFATLAFLIARPQIRAAFTLVRRMGSAGAP